jgi:hypothetical protein
VAAAALASLVPAWLAAGRGSQELWGSLLGALPGLPAPRRLRLLEALRKALPEVRIICLNLKLWHALHSVLRIKGSELLPALFGSDGTAWIRWYCLVAECEIVV